MKTLIMVVIAMVLFSFVGVPNSHGYIIHIWSPFLTDFFFAYDIRDSTGFDGATVSSVGGYELGGSLPSGSFAYASLINTIWQGRKILPDGAIMSQVFLLQNLVVRYDLVEPLGPNVYARVVAGNDNEFVMSFLPERGGSGSVSLGVTKEMSDNTTDSYPTPLNMAFARLLLGPSPSGEEAPYTAAIYGLPFIKGEVYSDSLGTQTGILNAWVKYTFTVTEPIPEPATILLLGSGLIGLAGYGRKKFFKK